MDGHLGCTFEKCPTCQELAELGQEIVEIEKTLRDRAQKRTQLMKSRNSTHCHMNRQLSPEITTHIFSLVQGVSGVQNHIRVAVLLSSVCDHWRNIALNQDELWTNVFINVCRKTDEMTEEFLKRSKERTLNVTLYADQNYKSKTWHLEINALYSLLRKHSSRWGYLDAEGAPNGSLHGLFDDLESLPRPDCFFLKLGDYRQAGNPISISQRTPLQPGRFHSWDFSFDMMPFGWNNLTQLELRACSAWDVLRVIRQAPILKRCVLGSIDTSNQIDHVIYESLEDMDFDGSTSNNATQIDHVVHEYLEDLDFDGSATDFFPNLTLTSLRNLKYHPKEPEEPESLSDYAGGDDLDLWQDLHNFLVRSSDGKFDPTSFLVTFTLGYSAHIWPDPDSDHAEFQALTHAVTHLSIQLSETAEVFDLLLQGHGSSMEFPLLQEVEVKVRREYDHRTHSLIVSTPRPDYCDPLCDYVSDYNHEVPLRSALKSITVSTEGGSKIRLHKETLLLLKESQGTGPLKIKMYTDDKEIDVLQEDSGWLEFNYDNDTTYIIL